MNTRLYALAVSLLLVVSRSMTAQPLSPREMREADPQIRRAWYGATRAFPGTSVPPENMAAMHDMRASIRRGRFASSTTGQRWQSLGPTGFVSMNTPYSSTPMVDGGRFTSIAINPKDSRNIIAGSGSAGVWRTTNGGVTWQATSDFECSLSIGAVTIDPADPRILYAGTGEIFDPAGFTDGCGILRSANGGDTWVRTGTNLLGLSGRLGSLVYQIAIDRATAGSTSGTTLLAATSEGVLRTTNSGNAWARVLPGFATAIVQHPTQSGTFYAALGNTRGDAENGLYRTTNGGDTWTRVSQSLGSPSALGRMALAVSAARPGSVWALVGNPTNRKFLSLSRYDEGTQTLTTLPAQGIQFTNDLGDFGDQSEYNLLIGVDPDDANRVIIGGVRLFRSRDGGLTFQQIASDVHSDWHDLAFDPNDPRRIVTGCDGGIFTSTNGGDSWRSLNSGISAVQFYPGIAVHPTNPGIVVGGTQDNGSMMSNGALLWAGISFGDGGWALIDYTNPNLMLTSSQNGNLQRHDLSTRSFQPLRNTLNFQPPFITPFIIDPLNPRTIYAGTSAVEVSRDFGSTFTQLSPAVQGQVTALAVNRASPQRMLAGTNDGFLIVSADGGATWNGGSPVQRAVSDIAYDPNDNLRFAVTWSGFGAAKVGLSTTGGFSYTNITGDLPDIPVNAFSFTPQSTRFFAATDIGVFETTNSGVSWTITEGMPAVPVTDLVYHAPSNRLIAGSYGRGIWSLPLATEPPVLRGDVNRDGVVNAADALLIQQGLAQVRLPAGLTVMPYGDANCNGALDAADALIVLRFAVALGTGGTCVNTAQ